MMSRSAAVRAIEQKYRAQQRRRTRRIGLIALGVGVPLMSLASWYVVQNYRLVHDSRDGSTRWMSVEEVEAKRLAGERARRAAAPPTRVRVVEAPAKPSRSAPVEVQAAPAPAKIIVEAEPVEDQKVVEFFGMVETEGTLREHDRRTPRERE